VSAPLKYVAVVTVGGDWGVGELYAPPAWNGEWCVDVKRTGMTFEDAADLRDAWNARGTEKRR
jgi:hypothetical protein